ncbi:mediator of RNA polymerase II transcription subunit 9 isoform X1 [Punica granatum]|uniref:Mediator of RNA polymerase II transcription subunit 9 n=1 Tax=Punica granatum TaxID=22663 RepID=A0A218WV21_PUNGR|nr:mediator of RNA polymerase II transcription subunit 9 isoform X1 [Punica granatum]XP_031386470.1 mediator of RNA polymerase II transcription subunit 9 isoform X1 [Punica granatum]XP_031386471.1 mediator of RNA polymerase II transcription subunit 9 isoform X1 [Punica granatum]OWM76684.1 hypothetical protein CDL15_Pgr009249 [Punica granatum]
MDPAYTGGGSWNMIPSMPAHSNISAASSQDHLFHQQQQLHQFQKQQQQFQQQFQQQQQQQHQQQHQRLLQHQQQQQQQQQQHQSLASHFHLLHLVESLAEAIENGTRDQHSDALIGVKVSELKNNFEKCQQLLNSIAGSISSKAVTVEGQRHKLEETEQILNQRRDLIGKYRNSVEELINSEL